MRKSLLLTVLLVLSAVCLQAGLAAPPSDKSQTSFESTTLQGCLKVVLSHYILTEDDGTVHTLSGAARKLGPQVGHEIAVTGKPGTRTEDATSSGGASSVREYVVFEVKTVTPVSDTCKTVAH